MDKAIIIEERSLLTICFWCFDLWGLADPGEIAPHRISHFLEIVKDLPGRVPSYVITDPEPTPQWPVFFELSQGSHTQSHCLPALIPPRSRYWTPRGRPCASDPTEIIHISQPRLACSFLQKQQQRLLCPFPVVLSASWMTQDFPVWPLVAWHASPLGNCE